MNDKSTLPPSPCAGGGAISTKAVEKSAENAAGKTVENAAGKTAVNAVGAELPPVNLLVHMIESSNQQINNRIDDLRAESNQRFDDLGKQLNGKIDDLGKALNGRIDDLGDRLDGKIDDQGKRLDGKIDDLGRQLGDVRSEQKANLDKLDAIHTDIKRIDVSVAEIRGSDRGYSMGLRHTGTWIAIGAFALAVAAILKGI